MSARDDRSRLVADDERLGAVLASIGEHLDLGDGIERSPGTPLDFVRPTPLARRSVRQGGRGRVVGRGVGAVAAAVVMVAVAVAVLVGVTPVRDAVAGWLGVGSSRVERVPADDVDVDGLGVIADTVRVIDADEARRRGVDVAASATTPLGSHDWLGAPPEGGVLIGWDDGATTLWVRAAGDGATVKRATLDDVVVEIEGLGDAAVLIVGDHVLSTPHRDVAAGTVVLWTVDGVDLRLESELSVDRVLAQAHESSGFVVVPDGAEIDSGG